MFLVLYLFQKIFRVIYKLVKQVRNLRLVDLTRISYSETVIIDKNKKLGNKTAVTFK